MSIEKELLERCHNTCELCASADDLDVYEVSPSDGSSEQSIMACAVCREQLADDSKVDTNHWRCLNDSMWSEVPAVQVVAYRMLTQLGEQDLLDMMYMEEETKAWAEKGISSDDETVAKTIDSNGSVLEAGDTVHIIKDLEVKGAGFTAKRGTAVRNIALTNNPEQIEGRVNGTRIVLLTKFLKKA